MTTITTKQPVTLTVEQTEQVLRILRDYSGDQSRHANRSKSGAIVAHCRQNAETARTLEETMTRALYLTEDLGPRCRTCKGFGLEPDHDQCFTCLQNEGRA